MATRPATLEKHMSSMMKTLGIDRLTPDQRIDLALEIWESLGEFPSQFSSDAKLFEEIHRRDAELRANPGIALTWEEVRRKVERRQ
jgi:putative addiction module component (TIGR02574 family)